MDQILNEVTDTTLLVIIPKVLFIVSIMLNHEKDTDIEILCISPHHILTFLIYLLMILKMIDFLHEY